MYPSYQHIQLVTDNMTKNEDNEWCLEFVIVIVYTVFVSVHGARGFFQHSITLAPCSFNFPANSKTQGCNALAGYFTWSS